VERKVAQYRLLRQLGIGGAAEVYLAEDTSLGLLVALKLLHPHLTKDESHVKRFRQEAQWASLLNHPNVLDIYEVGESEGVHFIATEYIEGDTLRSHILAEIPLWQVVDVAIGVSSALHAAHAVWIVHRDIKPENIMLRHRDGQVKVLDFGLAKLTQPSAGTPVRPLTGPGTVLGTLQYLAPEQLLGGGVDPRTDLFSLGVVLYELVTGQPPFGGNSNRELIGGILHSEPPPMTRAHGTIPEELHRIVGRALQKDAEDRYQSAGEILGDLESLRLRL
jgi:serine/threonine protein kinase